MPSKWKQHLSIQLPPSSPHNVWVHACSMGEVSSVSSMIKRLLAHGYNIHLTVVTRTGFAHAQRLFKDEVSVSWLPWDLPFLMARFIKHLQPSLLLLCETEFWPGMLRACKKHKITVIGINTRISDRSFPKYYATRWLWKRYLSVVSLFLAQSDIDTKRLTQIGVKKGRIKTVGNLKFAIQAPEVDAQQLRHTIDPSEQRPILVIASTHDDEEAQILSLLPAWQHIQPNLLTLIVPRHPERFADIANLLQQQAIPYTRYAQKRTGKESVILIDAMGVLTKLYTIADLVFIGGSLSPIGGHNPLEAAICGRGVVTGAHIQNFRRIMQDMQHQSAAIIVQDHHELQTAISRLLQHPDELKALHAHAALFMQNQQGVLDCMWQEIEPLLKLADQNSRQKTQA